MSVDVLMLPSADIEFRPEGMLARTAWGQFTVPPDVYARSLRLDRRYPGNYADGYLDAWCCHQWKKQKQ